MKSPFANRFIFVVVAGAIFSTFQAGTSFAQEAERVDRLYTSTYDASVVKEKITQFVHRLSEAGQAAEGLVITYSKLVSSGRCRDDAHVFDEKVESTLRKVLSEYPPNVSSRIKFRNDDMSRVYQADFWIIRDGAAEPPVQESGYKPQCPVCPLMRIRRTSEKATNDGKIEFEAVIDRVCSEDRMNWIVSAGKIISGHGSQKILVDISNAKEPTLTVTFNLSPWRPECFTCPHEVSLTTEIHAPPPDLERRYPFRKAEP